jgi:peptidoglycan/LPS O-acetylase OafA/YrhL
MTTADPAYAAAVVARGDGSIKFLTLLRAAAPLLVVWDHFGAVWPNRNDRSWFVNENVRDYVNAPLGVIQDFGWLGVAIFFLISGFIIPYVALREDAVAFGTKRAFRIFPPLWASIALIIVVNWFRTIVLDTEAVTYSLGDVVKSAFLVNYLQPGGTAINGVAWTLIIEVLFYSLCLIGWPVLQRRPASFVLGSLAAIWLGVNQAFEHGATFHQVIASVGYLPVLLLGTCLYLRWSGRISIVSFALLSGACWVTFVQYLRHVRPEFYDAMNSYGISVALAYAIFVIALLLDDHITIPAPVRFVSDISYSLYLTHSVVGFFVFDVLVTEHQLSFAVSLFVAIALALATAYVSWRYVERPTQRAARHLLARRMNPDQPIEGSGSDVGGA